VLAAPHRDFRSLRDTTAANWWKPVTVVVIPTSVACPCKPTMKLAIAGVGEWLAAVAFGLRWLGNSFNLNPASKEMCGGLVVSRQIGATAAPEQHGTRMQTEFTLTGAIRRPFCRDETHHHPHLHKLY